MAFRFVLTIALVVSVVLGDTPSNLPSIPGASTAQRMMASTADGMSRYLAPDGPIQPAITAGAGLPVRGAERLNQGITGVSDRFHNGAQQLSRAAGDNGNIRMPGLDTLESRMPESLSRVGEQIHGAIRSKNNFIRGQADQASAAMNRLSSRMHGGAAQAQDFLAKGRSTMQGQMEQHMNEMSKGLGQMRGFGQDLGQQAQGIQQTVRNGAQGALGQLQRTGQDVVSQLQNNHARNTNQLSNMMGSLRNSMSSNLNGLVRPLQSAAQQVSGSLREATQMPMKLLSNLGNMVQSGVSGGSNAVKGAGRY